MADPTDRSTLRVTGNHRAVTEPSVEVREKGESASDDVMVIVTQAFGPKGDNLVGISDVTFDGQPAVTLKLRAAGKEGLIHLSPIHGDGRKAGFVDVAPGTRCEIMCPVSGLPLDMLGEVEDMSGARYYALYLTAELSRGSMVMISDTWGHYHSRIIDNFELISAWAAGDE